MPPFRLDFTVWALRRRQDNIVDRWDGRVYRRVLVLEDIPVEITVEQAGPPEEPELHVTAIGSRPSVLAPVLERMLGIRVELGEFYRLAAHDAQLGPLAQQFRGLKPPRFPTLFEALVNAIACQQLTLTLGIRLLNRLTAACGTAVEKEGIRAYAFPRPQELAALEPEDLLKLGFSRQKARALLELARKVTGGYVNLEEVAALDDSAAVDRLSRLHGVGRWTAEYVLLRGLGRLHVFPGDDAGARSKLRRWLGIAEELDYEGVHRILECWNPYGGVVYFHLLLKSLAEQGDVQP